VSLKGVPVALRPVFHQTDRRVAGHLFISLLA
jgi:transposase